MDLKDFIATAAIIVALIGPFVTWMVMRKQYANKRITYDYLIDPIIKNDDEVLAEKLKVSYNGKDINQPALLSLMVVNSGLAAIESLVIKVCLPSTSYVIPCYFVNKPDGYEDLWAIKSIDSQTCEIIFNHINQKQIAEIRFLIDEAQQDKLKITCAMPNVEFIRNKIFLKDALKVTIISTLNSGLLFPLKLKL